MFEVLSSPGKLLINNLFIWTNALGLHSHMTDIRYLNDLLQTVNTGNTKVDLRDTVTLSELLFNAGTGAQVLIKLMLFLNSYVLGPWMALTELNL